MHILTSGEKLFNWVQNQYSQNLASDTWIEQMQDQLNMHNLSKFLYKSTCLMIVRRLIWNGHWYYERFEDTSDGHVSAEKEFENTYLRQYFGYSKSDAKNLRLLVFKAVQASKKKVSARLDKDLFERASLRNEKCKLCGGEIEYTAKRGEDKSSFSLDHIWPCSLGGESEEWNLQETHKICNDLRQNTVDESDTHYEHFHVKTSWIPNSIDQSFWKELDWSFKFAALFMSNFQCSECNDDPPKKVHQFEGNVMYSVIDRVENYNIFNIRVTCERHQKLLDAMK